MNPTNPEPSAPFAPEITEAQIERAARFFANAYVRGFRSAALTGRTETLTVAEWTEANWQSFCAEAVKHIEGEINSHAALVAALKVSVQKWDAELAKGEHNESMSDEDYARHDGINSVLNDLRAMLRQAGESK